MPSDRCLSYTVCLSVTLVYRGNGWMDQDETWHGGRLRPRPHCVTWEPRSSQRDTALNFRPMSVVAKRLDGLRRHLVQRLPSAQATLCSMGTQLPPAKKGAKPMSVVA